MEHYEELLQTSRMPGTGETTTSPTMSFSENYEGVLVQFKVKRGTLLKLENIGISAENHSDILDQFPMLGKDTKPWNIEYARFKLEGEQVNISLGKGRGLQLFNDNIVEFKLIKLISKK